ncbi:MAG: GDP-mannose 4,6-dehydratase, partial [Methylophilaceae bacterium]
MSILVTGAAGFIGSNFVLNWLAHNNEKVIALDKLTYAGNLENLKTVESNSSYVFVQGDIGDSTLMAKLLQDHQPRAIVNFAAESHVDRSIHGPDDFMQTNILGTYRLLEEARSFFNTLSDEAKKQF